MKVGLFFVDLNDVIRILIFRNSEENKYLFIYIYIVQYFFFLNICFIARELVFDII